MKAQRVLTSFVLTAALLFSTAGQAAAQQADIDRAMASASRAIAEAARTMSRHVHDFAVDPQAGKVTEKFAKTVPLAKGGMVDLGNISGNITVTVGAGDQVVIDAIKRGRSTEELKEVTIDVTSTANRVEVRTRYPENRRNISVSVDYTVTVPKSAGVTIKSVSGDSTVTGIDGELQINTVSGDVHVTGAADLRSAKSVSGDVTLDNVAAVGTCAIKTISGDLTVHGLKAKEAQVDTISGDLKLDNLVLDRFTTKSISGDVHFAGPLAKAGRYEFSSHSGDITIQTSDKVGFELTASSFSGSITTDMAVTTKGDTTTEAGRRAPRKHSLQGTFGDGSAVLQLNTFSGEIKIVKK